MITLTGGDVLLSLVEKQTVDNQLAAQQATINAQAAAIENLREEVENARTSHGDFMHDLWEAEFDLHTKTLNALTLEEERGRANVENAVYFYVERFIQHVKDVTGYDFEWRRIDDPEDPVSAVPQELLDALAALTAPSIEECENCDDLDCPDRLEPEQPEEIR